MFTLETWRQVVVQAWRFTIVQCSMKHKWNIEETKLIIQVKVFGLTLEVLSIANNEPLGQWRIQSWLMLRQAMLVNGTLYNTECCQGLDVDSEILGFAKPDEALLRGLVFGHSKVPLEFLFLETGCVPVPLIHACRRIIYHHTNLRKERSELVSRIYQTQKTDSLPGDFKD